MQGKYDIIVNVKPFSQAVKAVDFDSMSASSILARAVLAMWGIDFFNEEQDGYASVENAHIA